MLRRGELAKRIQSIRVVYFDPVGLHELMRGDEGPRVTQLQARLRQLGYYQPRTSSGVFDRTTVYAVSHLQRKYKLKQTGILSHQCRIGLGKLKRSEPGPDDHQTNQKSEVTHAIDNESLIGSARSGVPGSHRR